MPCEARKVEVITVMTDLEHENFRYVVKCDWLRCAAGMGLAGNGNCSFRGNWKDKDCVMFITDEDFLNDWKERESNT